MINLLGSIGFGMVWGWLAVLVGGRGAAPWWNIIPLLSATAAVALLIFSLTTLSLALYFLGAAILSALIHKAWIEELRRRVNNSA